MNYSRKEFIKNTHRIVVKIGTSSLTHSNGLLNFSQIEKIVRQLADLHNKGFEVILVTSGAIGAGMGKLGLKIRPNTIPEKQAAAAVGQGVLLHTYEKIFSEYSQTVAQILITKEDIIDPSRYKNAHNTLSTLLHKGVIPIINENDAVVVDEIRFGDNDTLSALICNVIEADLLIILSDIDGLYNSNPQKNPNAKLIHFVDKITKEIEDTAEDKGSNLGTGGMITKLHAAKIANSKGTSMIIANGSVPDILEDIIDGKDIGTWFNAKQNRRDIYEHRELHCN